MRETSTCRLFAAFTGTSSPQTRSISRSLRTGRPPAAASAASSARERSPATGAPRQRTSPSRVKATVTGPVYERRWDGPRALRRLAWRLDCRLSNPETAPRVDTRMRLAVIGVLLFAVALAAPAEGRDVVVYVCGKDLCRVAPDGKQRQRLTRDGARTGPYSRPAISRAGRRLAFRKGSPGGRVAVRRRDLA